MGSTDRLPPELAHPPAGYELECFVGAGESGVVYRARDSQGRTVALKVGGSLAERARLADEAERLALVDSPHIPKLVDAGAFRVPGEEGDRPYLALQWSDGAALDAAKMTASDRLSALPSVGRDVGAALSALHAVGFAHGDVKPANVLVTTGRGGSGRARLVDLGLGGSADEVEVRGGTLRYLSPECFAAGTGDGRARDVYAFGLLLVEMASDVVRAAEDPRVAALSGALPKTLEMLVRPLLASAPAARPSADWVVRRLGELFPSPEAGPESPSARHAAVRRAYLSVRRGDLLRVARGGQAEIRVGGAPRAWLEEARTALERVASLRGMPPSAPVSFGELSPFERARFLTSLVGAPAARWPALTVDSDEALVARLLTAVEAAPPASLRYSELARATARVEPVIEEDPISLALALASNPSTEVVDRAEAVVARGSSHPALALSVARALRLQGELGRAQALLLVSDAIDARIEAAECARRAGDARAVEEIFAAMCPSAFSHEAAAKAAAIRARLAFDRGDVSSAAEELAGVAPTASVLEVSALLSLAGGDLDAARDHAESARLLATNDEEHARALAVLGNIAHAAGDARRAFEWFRQAVDRATRAFAVLEEATYLTGVAASGFEAGELAESLDAATRATLLFEHLGRTDGAARALLARAAVLGAAGSVTLAREAAELCLERAAKDVRGSAFAHLAIADFGSAAPDALEHARRATRLLDGHPAGDRLRAAARLHLLGEAVAVAEMDRIAEDETTAVPARLEWWGSRASVASRTASPVRADRVLSALSALGGVPAPVSTRGEAFAAGAALAAAVGDGDAARRFSVIGADAARSLVAGAPPELRAPLSQVPWAGQVRSPRESGVLPEQIADIESLVRSLGTRDRLRPLLDQVLDALVLWTGVERGLLLLRAPGERLVPRAARNLSRTDLVGAQLALSRSLAERALRTGDPVVAVDAAGELPEVHKSVHALKLRSVLAVPLVARGEALGVVYLDDRVRRGAFGPSELAWVRLVATLAAVAISDSRAQLELRRAARRAARAEARLSTSLAAREAELDVTARELARVQSSRATRYSYDEIIGDSAEVKRLLALVDRVTPTEVPVLVTGESGSGKELVARAIHKNGPRCTGPFVGENCGAIPEALLESTLFGHVRGAFTGANRPHAGLFEVAGGGTLFLDEIGEMSLGMQTKLLRVLEERAVRPVGSDRLRKVDVRVIAASHRDLTQMVARGSFRSDLLYRLDVIRIAVPPLRERPSDVEPLARHFMAKHATGPVRLSRPALAVLAGFSWPGNVRQLENEIRRALVLADGAIGPEHLSAEIRDGGKGATSSNSGFNVRQRVDALEMELVRAALEQTGGNQTRAAELLGLSRFGLQKMIRRLDIRVELPEAHV